MSDSDTETENETSTDDGNEGGSILDEGIDTDERAGRSLGIDPTAEPDEDTVKEIEEERDKRLDPDNRPENAEVDNTPRTFDVEHGKFTDSDDYDEGEPAPFSDPEDPNNDDDSAEEGATEADSEDDEAEDKAEDKAESGSGDDAAGDKAADDSADDSEDDEAEAKAEDDSDQEDSDSTPTPTSRATTPRTRSPRTDKPDGVVGPSLTLWGVATPENVRDPRVTGADSGRGCNTRFVSWVQQELVHEFLWASIIEPFAGAVVHFVLDEEQALCVVG